ncbi:MAG: metallophosphoesterase [Pirellulales bacterium]|nr:metallophosphoesterase [Pirellulales bacterium]
MPIHLPPINRRDFLSGTVAAGAGLLLPRNLLAEETTTDPNLWVLMADVHVPADREKIHRGIQPAKNLALAIERILAFAPRPAGMIVAGDVAIDYGEAGDYATLGALLKPLRAAGVPVHFALGNHDNRKRFLAAFPDAERAAAVEPQKFNKFVSIVEAPQADWILLDSLSLPDGVPGRMGKAELQWLAETLDARADRPALLVAHHNPDRNMKAQGLLDTAEFLAAVLPRKQVKAYFYGHTHAWNVSREDDLRLVNVPGNVWLFDKTQPRGFLTARLQPAGANIQLHSLDPTHSKHGERAALKWRA